MKKKNRYHTLDEYLAITRKFCPGASDEWLESKFNYLSPIECFDAWRRECRERNPEASKTMLETHKNILTALSDTKSANVAQCPSGQTFKTVAEPSNATS